MRWWLQPLGIIVKAHPAVLEEALGGNSGSREIVAEFRKTPSMKSIPILLAKCPSKLG